MEDNKTFSVHEQDKQDFSVQHDYGYAPSDEAADSVAADSVPQRYRGTEQDKLDMKMLGKKQVLRRNFNKVTMIGFASMALVAWQAFAILNAQYALSEGGRGTIFWGAFIAPLGLAFTYLSISELSSMSPTAGGQYHWVSEIASPKYQRVLSYVTGWSIALGWQTWLAGSVYMATSLLNGMLMLNFSSYEALPWHTTVISIGIVVFCSLFNTVLASRLPSIEGALLILHVGGFLAVVIVLWTMSPIAHPWDVVTDFTNYSGWNPTGLGVMISLPYVFGSLYGYDCIVHMAEEMKDASQAIPYAIMGGLAINGVMYTVLAITLVFTMGDPATILQTPYNGMIIIQMLLNATGSVAATNTLTSIMFITLVCCCFSEVATTSRQIWSFARDKGFPFHRFFAYITPGWNLPLNAVLVSIVVTSLLSCISLGSSEAFTAINSLSEVAILGSYMLTISCLIWRRIAGPPLPPRRWSLGRYGLAVNITAMLILTPIFAFTVWPAEYPVTLLNMNWSIVILFGVIFLSTAWYFVSARRSYEGPVAYIKRV